MTGFFMQNAHSHTPSVLAELEREIFGITDRPPYQVDGHVVAELQGIAYDPAYAWQQPYQIMQGGEEFRMMLLGVFLLIALAIILRR